MGRLRSAVAALGLGALAFGLWCGGAIAGVPTTQTCTDKGLGFSFTIPADWSCDPAWEKEIPGAVYAANAPARVAELGVYHAKVASDLPISSYTPTLVAVTRKIYGGIPGVVITASRATVGARGPGVLIKVRYRGIYPAAVVSGSVIHLAYFTLQNGALFEFDYSGVTPYVTKDLAAFAASVRSISFTNAA
jgi:hypothetical protein